MSLTESSIRNLEQRVRQARSRQRAAKRKMRRAIASVAVSPVGLIIGCGLGFAVQRRFIAAGAPASRDHSWRGTIRWLRLLLPIGLLIRPIPGS